VEKARISKKALVKVRADLDAEQVKTEAIHQEYIDKMRAHNDHTKHTLFLNKMLGEKKFQLDKKERDLAWQETVLTEAQAQGLNPRDNWEELMELVELPKHLDEAEVAHITEAR
jgi:hypothetical protein